jgi:transglutaminase-like putative cysteine protease
MLLHILHETRYDYSPAVEDAQHLAHLRPLDEPNQKLLGHALHISPSPAHQRTLIDVHGNSRTYFSLHSHHAQLRVQADSVVQTQTSTTPRLLASAPWEQVREQLRYRAGAPPQPASPFVFDSPGLAHHAEFAQFALPSFSPGRPIAEAAWDLMLRIARHMRYESLSTDVATPALQALRQGKGVCQDFAHILIACCRSLGLAARYVSGYLLTSPPPGQSRLIGGDASHAWASVYCPLASQGPQAAPSGFWLELDPTNARQPGADYVTLARGRDFLDVSPLRGVIHGGARHVLSVAVTVREIALHEAGLVPAPQAIDLKGLGIHGQPQV